MEKINFGFTSLFWFHESKPGLIITVIFNSATLEGLKELKRITTRMHIALITSFFQNFTVSISNYVNPGNFTF